MAPTVAIVAVNGNNAESLTPDELGYSPWGDSFEEMTPADFRYTLDVNLMGTVHTCRAAWPHM